MPQVRTGFRSSSGEESGGRRDPKTSGHDRRHFLVRGRRAPPLGLWPIHPDCGKPAHVGFQVPRRAGDQPGTNSGFAQELLPGFRRAIVVAGTGMSRRILIAEIQPPVEAKGGTPILPRFAITFRLQRPGKPLRGCLSIVEGMGGVREKAP